MGMRATIGLLATVAMLLGCPATNDREADEFAVATTTQSIQGIAAFAGAIDFIFSPDPSWEAMPEAMQRQLAIDSVRSNVETLISLTVCESVLTTTSDDMSFLEMSVGNCFVDQGGGYDGTLRVELEIGDVECGEAANCPAILWTLSSPDAARPFRIVNVRREGYAEWTNPSLLSAPFDVTKPKRYEAARLQMVSTREDKRVGFETAMSWTKADQCLTLTMSNTSSEIAEYPLSKDESASLPIFTRAEEVVSCLTGCPRQGDVVLSYGDGDLLGWAYNQTSTIDVRDTVGSTFSAQLECE